MFWQTPQQISNQDLNQMLDDLELPKSSSLEAAIQLPVVFKRDKNQEFMAQLCIPDVFTSQSLLLADNNFSQICNYNISEEEIASSKLNKNKSKRPQTIFIQKSHSGSKNLLYKNQDDDLDLFINESSFSLIPEPTLKQKNSESTDISQSLEELNLLDHKARDEQISVLKDFEYTISYKPSKGPRRRKRIIKCGYGDCGKKFTRTWNFIDHARMHLGVKPFSCSLCSASFTQKGNLKTHMAMHE
ncbi:unnamed protein product [Moneuplotes crassus]|uniref:C2H2-type domain-containing protein n=1 Tax=Euplotes crassus TaxID=5936 RepID=A0AAD1XI57_EUPCR|nr:unnamed protein product [Moneuplotes crassus]